MKIFIGSRNVGKTVKLIQLADNYNGYIVCHSIFECNNLVKKALQFGYKINTPITYDEFLNHRYYDEGIKKFFIDNVDKLLNHITNVFIEAITIGLDDTDDRLLEIEEVKK